MMTWKALPYLEKTKCKKHVVVIIAVKYCTALMPTERMTKAIFMFHVNAGRNGKT